MAQDERIHVVNLDTIDEMKFTRRHVGCIVLDKDGKILLQQRGPDWDRFPNCLATFGGRIENNETPAQALIRELNEELGAIVNIKETIPLGIITEAATNHSELIYVYFWKDTDNSIDGCYEGKMIAYDNVESALSHPQIMDDVIWALKECKKKNLL